MNIREHITPRQLFVIVFVLQLGIQMFMLPYGKSWSTGLENMLIILSAALVSQLLLVLLWVFGARGYRMNLYTWLTSRLSRVVSVTILFLLAIYFACSALVDTLYLTNTVRIWVLSTTPSFVLLVVFIAIGAYGAGSSLQSIANISQTVIFAIAIIGVLLIILIMREWDLKMILPIWHVGEHNVISVWLRCCSAFTAFELLLYAFPLLNKNDRRKGLIAVTWANWLSALLYLMGTAVSFLLYTTEQMHSITNPLFFAMKKLHNGLIQGIDMIAICLWILVLLIRTMMCLFMAAKAIDHLSRQEQHKHELWSWIVAGCCLIPGYFVTKHEWIDQLVGYRLNTTLILMGLMTIVFFAAYKRGTAARGTG
ncbi:GerAB/ArcD/ProY family transporter [Paenibacillus lupini]|uniref:GerAB/ArcD/ProY family transporter n=1 Tax=Paenibacillus lupini TaxID=1450204 RepID=UPI001421B5FE|nr:GerAB/ArcD/ProY family transporter [Paenibacillus lupini]NIK26070.1 hypothetical protein [Paenibacillus lupini]